MDLFHKPHRAEPSEPQLATMIDVFSILIIFLIAGTVMGNSSVILPAGLLPPKSVSKEALLASPQLTVTSEEVTLGFSQTHFPTKSFSGGTANADVEKFKSEIKTYLQSEAGKPNAGLVSFVADQGMTYDKIFNVIKVAREAGIQSILFISTARNSK